EEKHMSASKVIRLPEELRAPLVVPRGRYALIFLLGLPLLANAWQSTAPPAVTCKSAGQVFGWDLMGRTLTIKSDSGHYSDFRYDDSTVFTNGDTTPRPDNLGILEGLNIDDRLCVEAFREDNQEIASRVRITFRAEIDTRDRQELMRWQAESLFGTVK